VSTVELIRNEVAQPFAFPHSSALPADELSIEVLPTAESRRTIEPLRRFADFGSEYELDPGMADLEERKDELGIVMAISRYRETIATIRFIPAGHGLTLTERFWGHSISDPEILGAGSWEVGRLVMAPEQRTSDLLPRCMSMSLRELLRTAHVRHFHASCLVRMTRLYRRFGFGTHCVFEGAGKECALIHGPVERVAVALKVPLEGQFTMLK
jgi:predicted GNAT family N-acyltransferase